MNQRVVFGALMLICGGMLLLIVILRWLQDCAFRKRALPVTGIVRDKLSKDRRSAFTSELRVTCAVNGETYERWVPCTRWEYQTMEEGRAIELLYDPAHPSEMRRKESTAAALRPMLILALVVLAAGAGLVIAGLAVG